MSNIREKKLIRLRAQELKCRRKSTAYGLAEGHYRGRDRLSRKILGLLGLIIGVASTTTFNRADECGDTTNLGLILLVIVLGFLSGVISLYTTVNNYSTKEKNCHSSAGKYHEKVSEIGFFFTEDLSDVEMVKAFTDKVNDAIVEIDDSAPPLEAKFARKAEKLVKKEMKNRPKMIEFVEVKLDK